MQNQSQKIGVIGEEIAVNYLKKKGYQILARNFKTKWGELDIAASHNKTIVFVEVKTLKYNPLKEPVFSPEDEITFHKANQLRKMAQIYLSANRLPLDTSQQIDILPIELPDSGQIANIRHIENAISDY
jgi:putative endonuclease